MFAMHSLAAFSAVSIHSLSAVAIPRYSVHTIPFVPIAANIDGAIVGHLGTLGGTSAIALGINHIGAVVGFSTSAARSGISSRGRDTDGRPKTHQYYR